MQFNIEIFPTHRWNHNFCFNRISYVSELYTQLNKQFWFAFFVNENRISIWWNFIIIITFTFNKFTEGIIFIHGLSSLIRYNVLRYLEADLKNCKLSSRDRHYKDISATVKWNCHCDSATNFSLRIRISTSETCGTEISVDQNFLHHILFF